MRLIARYRTILGILLFIPLAGLLLVMFACLPAPVGDPANAKVDSALNGAWKASTAEGENALVLIRPWDTRTYYVEYMSQGKKDGNEDNTVMHFKAWLTTLGGSTFMTFEPLDRLNYVTKETDDKDWWFVAKLDIKPESITVRPVKEDPALLKDLDTREKIEDAITKNVGNDDLYGKEISFEKIASSGTATDAEKQLIKDTLQTFRVAK